MLWRSLASRTRGLAGAPVGNVVKRSGMAGDFSTGYAGASDGRRHVDRLQFETRCLAGHEKVDRANLV